VTVRGGFLCCTARDPRWLSNSFLVADRIGGRAVLIDSGGPTAGIEAAIAKWRVRLDLVLCTHHHADHVAHNEHYRRQHGAGVCAHAFEAARMTGEVVAVEGGADWAVGDLRILARAAPGHTQGQLLFLVGRGDGPRELFSGDTLFRGSVGGTRAGGHGTFAQLRESVLKLFEDLPGETRVHPGHMDDTTLGAERATNPFVQLWTDARTPTAIDCVALGMPAVLEGRFPDYDGGTKCQVRYADGTRDIVPGSRVIEARD
jgi:glyoxylase-like metal-dependent hydrolase (beta-lactamase superfamily II)